MNDEHLYSIKEEEIYVIYYIYITNFQSELLFSVSSSKISNDTTEERSQKAKTEKIFIKYFEIFLGMHRTYHCRKSLLIIIIN